MSSTFGVVPLAAVCASGTSFGATGGTAVALDGPADIVARSSGDILVADACNYRVAVYSATTLAYIGKWKRENNQGIAGLNPIAQLPNGNILVGTETTPGRVQELSSAGAHIATYNGPNLAFLAWECLAAAMWWAPWRSKAPTRVLARY
jgi:hypothetical protein